MGDEPFKFSIDDKKVQLMLKKAPDRVRETVKKILTAGSIDVQAHAREKEAPIHDGNLKRNIKIRIFSNKAEVSSDAKYSEVIEKGRTAGKFVPMKEGVGLHKWATDKGLPPYAVMKSIQQKGTKPNPFMQRTYDDQRPKVERLADRLFVNLVKELNA